jgi:hypothetical protein
MKIRMLMDNRVFFAKGSEVEVTEGEAKRLLSLGFAEKVEKAVKAEEPEEVKEEPVKETKKSNSKKK